MLQVAEPEPTALFKLKAPPKGRNGMDEDYDAKLVSSLKQCHITALNTLHICNILHLMFLPKMSNLSKYCSRFKI
jgi:hypothetical protein